MEDIVAKAKESMRQVDTDRRVRMLVDMLHLEEKTTALLWAITNAKVALVTEGVTVEEYCGLVDKAFKLRG